MNLLAPQDARTCNQTVMSGRIEIGFDWLPEMILYVPDSSAAGEDESKKGEEQRLAA
jgi:hypothetical protein